MDSPDNPLQPSLAEALNATFEAGAAVAGSSSADNGLALFLLGLITGVAAAVAAFFVYIHITRSRRSLSHLDVREEVYDDFEEPADSPSQSPQQRLPWERPDDWWKRDS